MSTVQDCTDQTLFGKNGGANSRDLRYKGLDLSRVRWRSLLEVVTPRKLTNDNGTSTILKMYFLLNMGDFPMSC